MKFFNRIHLIVLLLFNLIHQSILDRNICPKFCDCDDYKGYNRAVCSDQRLINTYIDMPTIVQYLDLSRNAITTLDDQCFEDLLIIKILDLSFNSIHTIFLDAFSQMELLTEINLSHNRLESFDKRIFEKNINLVSVNLEGNKFVTLANEPLLKSDSIEILILKDSKLSHIHSRFFMELPNLRKIDLSNNIIITTTTVAFHQLRKLQAVNLNNNKWLCDENTKNAILYMRNLSVKIFINSCNFDRNIGKKFERIMVQPNPILTEKPVINISRVWKQPENLQEICQKNCLLLIRQNEHKKCEDTQIYFLRVGFYCGVFLGSILIGTLLTTIWQLQQMNFFSRKKRPNKNYTNSERSEQTQNVFREPQTNQISLEITTSTVRRAASPPRRIRQTQSTPPRSQQNRFASTLKTLFRNRARHINYRSINRNTAGLIRRLSRSNLFLNARSGRRADCSEQLLISHGGSDLCQLGNESTANNVHDTPLVDTLESESRPRCETPPPAYAEII